MRKVRERKRLSLDAVEEMSSGYSERLTKSHLSRIENGLAEPSVRKLFALSQIYGMPLTSLAERFEIDLQREQLKVDITGKPPESIYEETSRLIETGRYLDALVTLTVAVDQVGSDDALADDERARWVRRFRLGVADCLTHLGRHEAAKRETEELLGDPDLSADEKLRLLQCFVMCCFRLGRLTVAWMGLAQAEQELRSADAHPQTEAGLAALRGNIATAAGRHGDAVEAYRHALRIYDDHNNAFEACKVRINMAWAMIEREQGVAAREQLEASLLVAEASGYDRLRALAMSHLGILAFRQTDWTAAESWMIRSNTIARAREFIVLVFRNCYYLLEIARETGDGKGVKANERTLRSLLTKIDQDLPEAEAFRAALAGGES